MKNNNNKPRNGDTTIVGLQASTHALSKRVDKIQKEISPIIKVTGTPVAASGVTKLIYLKRTVMIEAALVAGIYGLSALDLGSKTFGVFPDGAKILKMVVINRTGRNLIVSIPGNSPMMNRGQLNNEVQETRRTRWAPLSRFPRIDVDVPDTLAVALDTNSSVTLMEVRSADLATSAISIEITYLTMV